jgi:hypothetical protein
MYNLLYIMRKLFSLAILITSVSISHAQLGELGKKVSGIPGIDSLFKKGPAITTSIKDAKFEAADQDGVNPDAKPLSDLKRGPHGGFILEAGDYSATVQSYCLHAGTYGPSKGDAYLYAPVKGPIAKIVTALVENTVDHPEIDQDKVQYLLWAMIARTKFSDLPQDLQVVAGQLLTSQQILDLNGGAMGFLSDEVMKRGLINEPPFIQQVMQAENNLRSAMTKPATSYGDLEAIAVLTGQSTPGKDSREVPRGRWSRLPEGYWVRYMPNGYTNTVIEVRVDPGSKCIGTEFDPATQIATPCDTSRQRLIQSGRFYTNR